MAKKCCSFHEEHNGMEKSIYENAGDVRELLQFIHAVFTIFPAPFQTFRRASKTSKNYQGFQRSPRHPPIGTLLLYTNINNTMIRIVHMATDK